MASDGRRFTGDLLLEPPGAVNRGRLFTTIDEPGDVLEARREGDSLFVRNRVQGREIDFRFGPGPRGLAGSWSFNGLTGAIEARVVAAEPHGDLRPVPCRLAGVKALGACAVLHVPENRADSGGRWIPLNIAILPADTSPAAGALFQFAGGPGEAASDQAAGNAERFARIRRQRDIVMIDQRGTGHSNGLFCDFRSVTERAAALFGGAFPAPVAERCLAAISRHADTRFYDTATGAADVDAVRAWLGYDRVDVYGGSYGTRAALSYLRAYPTHVRTITLRAVLAPSASLILDGPRVAQRALDGVFAQCRADAACHAAYPALAAEFARVESALGQRPVAIGVLDPATGDSVSVEITPAVFGGAVRRMLMDARLRQRLPAAIHAAAGGSFATIAAGIERTVGVAGSVAWGMGLSVICAEDAPKLTAGRVADATSGTFLGSRQADGVRHICAHWPAAVPPAGYDAPVQAGVAALLISGGLDPATPPDWAARVAAGLAEARSVVMPGVAHTLFPSCATDLMATFVERGTARELDVSCVAGLGVHPFIEP